MRLIIRLAVVICCALAGLPPANAEKRVALVIGNASYTHIAGLPNVPNDAAAMAALFKAARFDTVDVRHNLGVAELRRALREFASRTADADVAVLFFAGHGIEVDRVNYLIPVDARLATDFDVEDEAVSLDRVLQALEPAKRLRLVILDACRENPFVKSLKRTVATRSIGRGLGRIEPATSNTLIAFATKANAVADDGKGPNSPFTAALIKHLAAPGLELGMASRHVRDEVLQATGHKQEPYFTGSLGARAFSIIAPSVIPAEPAGQLQLSKAERAWAAVKDSTSIAALDMFRQQYGAANPVYDRLAEARIEELRKPPAVVAPRPVIAPPKVVDPAVADFEFAERINSKEVWDEFLRKHPTGMHAAAARRRLAAFTSEPDAIEVVRSFYAALGSADGARASSLVIPEKRARGPFSATEIAKFYGSLTVPLRLTNLVSLGDSKFQADYTYRTDKRSCNGSAIVTIVRRDSHPLIEGIKALNNC